MSSFQNSESIKQAMYEELQNILCPDTSRRTSAEERLSQLKFTEGYGVYLAEFTMNPNFELGLRQLAAVMLKKYVETSWSANDETQTCEQAKKMIKSILPNGLCDPNSKIRTSVAYTISTIASHDWPSNWMELFDIIVKCLSGNENSVHGAMQVLVEFTYDLNNQISNVGPIIMSEVYRIFTADTVYSLKTRSCAVDIFKQILKSIITYVPTKEEQSALLAPVMDPFIQKMVMSLDNRSDCVLKTSILKCFGFMLNYMPRYIQPHFTTILTPVWQLMAQTAEIYVKVIVNQTIESPFPENDDDDEMENFTTMILQMFEFIHGVIECGKFKALLRNVLSDLIYFIIVYMQITEEQVDNWSTDPEKFVQDEDEQSVDYSIRVSAQDVLTAIGQNVDKIIPGLQDALSRHYNVAEQEKSNNNRHWWKIHEACMLAVSGLDYVIEGKSEVKFNLTEYMNACKTLMGDANVSPFLTGRCLCLMSLFSTSEIYTEPLLTELLNMICAHLAGDKPIVVRICAVRAVQYFCENFKGASAEKKELVLGKLGVMFEGVFSLIGLGKYDILNLLLETIFAIVSFDETFTGSIQNKVIPLTIAIFLKHHEDRYTLELVLDLLKVLAQNSYCLGPLQERIVPTLVSILNLDKEQGHSTTMQDRGLDVLTTIIRSCKSPLSDALMESAFPAAVHCILRTDDQTVMQSGGKCMRAFIHVAPEQVCNFREGWGLNQIMQITTMLLNPMLNTDAPAVGEMVITLIARAGNYLGENIYLLLKAVISKLQTVNNWDFNMNLIMIFAHLFLTQMDALLNFLGTVPGPTGEPAITFIFTNWLSHHGSFYGLYCRKVSLMALCKVFEYGVTAKDNRLTAATMKVVMTMNPSAAVKTRSQCANAQQVVILPILVRILQILIAEVAHLREMQQAHLDQADDDDDDSDGDDDAAGGANDEDKLEPFHGIDSDEEDEEDDPLLKDLLNDPIMQSDFDLIKFMQNFSRDDTFKEFLVHLNDTEKEILRSIQVSSV